MVDLQSTNRVKIAKVREATFGTTPATPAFKAIRQTSSNLSANPQTVVSNEISSDRQVADLILVGLQSGGDIGGEVSFKSMDDDLEEVLQGTWLNQPSIEVVTADTEISAVSTTTLTVASGGAAFVAGMLAWLKGFTTAANNRLARVSSSGATSIVFPSSTFTAEGADIPVGAAVRVVGFMGASGDIAAVTSGGNALTSTLLDFTTLGLTVGQWLQVGGTATDTFFAGTAVNNDWVRISAITSARLSLDRVPAGWTADAGTSKTIQVFMGDFLTNGSTKRSNTIERQYLDHSPVTYEYLRGQTLDRLAFNAPAAVVATYTKSYVGADGVVQSSRFSGATDVAAPTNDVMNTSSNVGRIGFDGANVTGPNYVMSATWEYNNNLRRQMAVAHLGAVGIGNGEFTVTGALNTYFGDKTVLDMVFNNTKTSFDIRLGRTDSYNETLVFDFPSIKLASGSPEVSGKNADVMINANFQAIRDATLGYTASVGRFWYLP